MSDGDSLDRNYLTAFLRYLPRREEAALASGYELGRVAATNGVSILDLARIHHDVLLTVLDDTPVEDVARVAAAASEFLVEVLATYDMIQRGLLQRERG